MATHEKACLKFSWNDITEEIRMQSQMNALTGLPTLAFLLQSFSDWKHWAGCSIQEKDDVTQKTELLVNIFV